MTAENMCDFNDFDEEEKVHPIKANAVIENGTVKITLPKMSVAVLTVE
jgi:alpha-L-arabinofuranosidase